MNRWRVLVNSSLPILEALKIQLSTLMSSKPMTPSIEGQIVLIKQMIAAQEELIDEWKKWARLDESEPGKEIDPRDLIKPTEKPTPSPTPRPTPKGTPGW